MSTWIRICLQYHLQKCEILPPQKKVLCAWHKTAFVLYTHMHIHLHIHAESKRRHNDKDERRLLLKNIPLILFESTCVWEGVGDRTELQYIDPPFLWPSALCLSRSPGLLNRRPGGPALCWMLAFSIASCPQLLVSKTGLQNWSPKLTDFLSSPSYIIVQSPTQSSQWHVWSSSSGNNCHAVHRSLSSGASVCDCTMRFYLVTFCQPSPPTLFLPITAIGMCHFRCLWNGMFGRVEGQYTTFEG